LYYGLIGIQRLGNENDREMKHQIANKKVNTLTHYHREILESQIEVQKQAFERVGAELYDNIGQMLSVAKMYLYSLEDTELNQVQRNCIEQTSAIVGQSITDLRGLIRQLEGCMIQDFDLQQCVSQHLRWVRKNYQVTTELLITGIPYVLEYEKAIVLMRVLKDAISGIFRDIKVRQLRVKLHYGKAKCEVVIEGEGLPLTESAEVWPTIQQRLKLIEGHCVFDRNPEKGISVKIKIKHSSFNSPSRAERSV
jgi:signal transduction histidine kinase